MKMYVHPFMKGHGLYMNKSSINQSINLSVSSLSLSVLFSFVLVFFLDPHLLPGRRLRRVSSYQFLRLCLAVSKGTVAFGVLLHAWLKPCSKTAWRRRLRLPHGINIPSVSPFFSFWFHGFPFYLNRLRCRSVSNLHLKLFRRRFSTDN